MGTRDHEEAMRLEQERLSRTIANKHGMDITKEEHVPGKPNTKFYVYLEGIPSEPGSPVVVLINNKEFYNSGDLNGDVNTTIVVDEEGFFNNVPTVTLKIPTFGFESAKPYKLQDGFHLKFLAGPKGLQIKQQNQPF